MMEKDDIKYVTYRSLMISIGSVVSLVFIVFGLYLNHMDKKVNREVYDRDYGRLCEDINVIKNTVDDNKKMLERFNQNQVLVLRHLKIDPVR